MIDDSCSSPALISGDTNNNSKLDVNETWIYKCSTNLSATHTNTVVATGSANGISAVDIAKATVVVGASIVPPLIHVTKIPNPLLLPTPGGTVTYTETVTNPGTVALSNVTLTDDKCSPVAYVSGDLNNDSKLDSNESWIYTCTTNLNQTTTNTATATGTANGLTAKDLAVATVVVSIPHTPKTGFPPKVVSGLPVRLLIPKINIDAAIESLGVLPDGSMDAPAGALDVAWLDLGTRPGQIGSAVIDGHSGYKNNKPAVFDDLSKLHKGDEIQVKDKEGATITFRVNKIKSYGANETLPSVFGSTDGLAHLNLITCDGTWNPTAQTHSSRLVVFADKE
jgi:LPXTG-site transpeptidase (sortase) family protein